MIGENCWICNKSKGIQKHHAIPKMLKPKKNTIIPLCSKCHRKIHSTMCSPKTDVISLVFMNMKQKDGTPSKLTAYLPNGKIVYPDRKIEEKVKENTPYMCKIREFPQMAFATEIEEIQEKTSKLRKFLHLRPKSI